MKKSQNFKSRSRDPFTIPFHVILHFFDSTPLLNLCVKYDAIFIDDPYMVILLHCRFGCEMPISVHFGEDFFWGAAGGGPPKCSRILSMPPKGKSLAGNNSFWRIVPDPF